MFGQPINNLSFNLEIRSPYKSAQLLSTKRLEHGLTQPRSSLADVVIFFDDLQFGACTP
jgi:hypothetical protein